MATSYRALVSEVVDSLEPTLDDPSTLRKQFWVSVGASVLLDDSSDLQEIRRYETFEEATRAYYTEVCALLSCESLLVKVVQLNQLYFCARLMAHNKQFFPIFLSLSQLNRQREW